ncbi:MAG: cation:proton antiporter [Thaumarchaeota archaeon]|nr:cation:proton antiporter [Nitrososphaerota archaeon]
MAISTEAFLLVFSVIIFIGFAGNWLLSKKGIPQTLFLIAAGIATRWLGVLPASSINALLPLLSEVTLVMVVLDIGMAMKIREVMTEGRSAVIRSSLYMLLSIVLVTYVFTALFQWSLYQALFLGSIVGGDVTMVVVPYLAKRTSRTYLISNLAIESVYDSLILIIFFFVLLNGYTQQTPLNLQGVSYITSQFFIQLSVGLVGGVFFGVVWLRVSEYLGRSEYFYLATIGFILLVYVAINSLGGSGVITVLTVGLMMTNVLNFPSWTGSSKPLPMVSRNYLSAFQGEVSFFLSSFFLFFLGFSVPASTLVEPQTYLPAGLVVAVLLATRFVSTEAVDRGKPVRDRRFIESMLAEGLTPALLATTLVADSVLGASQIFTITTLVIVATNIISAGGIYFAVRKEHSLGLESLRSAAPLVKELGVMAAGLAPDTIEEWTRTVEEDAKKEAPEEVKARVRIPSIPSGDVSKATKEMRISKSALPYILKAIEKDKAAMPEGTRAYFESLEVVLLRQLRASEPEK